LRDLEELMAERLRNSGGRPHIIISPALVQTAQ
jgi:hypothetical protein